MGASVCFVFAILQCKPWCYSVLLVCLEWNAWRLTHKFQLIVTLTALQRGLEVTCQNSTIQAFTWWKSTVNIEIIEFLTLESSFSTWNCQIHFLFWQSILSNIYKRLVATTRMPEQQCGRDEGRIDEKLRTTCDLGKSFRSDLRTGCGQDGLQVNWWAQSAQSAILTASRSQHQVVKDDESNLTKWITCITKRTAVLHNYRYRIHSGESRVRE